MKVIPTGLPLISVSDEMQKASPYASGTSQSCRPMTCLVMSYVLFTCKSAVKPYLYIAARGIEESVLARGKDDQCEKERFSGHRSVEGRMSGFMSGNGWCTQYCRDVENEDSLSILQ